MTLPICAILPKLQSSLATHQTVILQAPPGSGKTTRVPPALLNADWLAGRKIIMLEPRRLAVTNSANYMAKLSGKPIGETVGYTVRYQQQVSKQTQIEIITEGILTRRLQSDPELGGIGLIIFDEFHERSLNSDLALALCRDAQLGLREDLKILIMSATLDGAPLATLLDAPLLTSDGISYPVTIHHRNTTERNLIIATITAIKQALTETSGDILVFLPGAAEIKRCGEVLKNLNSIDICPLYGALPYALQEKAINRGERRKVVLATNIAETSLTIEGIAVVIDSGYAREPHFDPASGLTRLEKVRISQASATQRSGRAGRLEPGTCYRLWDKATHDRLMPFTPPEINHADLSSLALELANWGIRDPQELTWLDPPPTGAFAVGQQLLQLLGVLNDSHQLTPTGKQIAQLPTHPRLGCLLLMAKKLDCLPLACDIVALLSEPTSNSQGDLQTQLETLSKLRRQNHLVEYRNIERASHYWRKRYKLRFAAQSNDYDPTIIGKLLLTAFPDRIGRLRQGEQQRYLFASGQGGRLKDNSLLINEKFLVATELSGKRGEEGKIFQATALSLDTILEVFPNLDWHREIFWDGTDGKIVARKALRLGKLNLIEKPVTATLSERNQALLSAFHTEGLNLLNWSKAVETFRTRVDIVQENYPQKDWPDLSNVKLLTTIEAWLFPFLISAKNRNDLKRINLLEPLQTLFTWQQLQQLNKLTPERFLVPSGSNHKIQYSSNSQPVLAIKLQEMFGTIDTPKIVAGKVPLQLHLLSPAGRPLQITQNLNTFWDEVYPEIKKEMKGRYPKHPWPDDPRNALPTRHTKKREARIKSL